MTKSHLGQRLKQARKEESARRGHSVTQGDIADASGLSRVNISMIERGERNSMPVEALGRVADYLNTSFWELATGETGTPDSLKKKAASNTEPAPDPKHLSDYIEIAAEIQAVSGQLINHAKDSLPTDRLLKRLTGLCNEFVDTIPTKPAN